MSKHGPSGFIVVMPYKIFEIPQDSNLSWLTLYYALPRELVDKRPECYNIPRNFGRLVLDQRAWDYVNSDAFLEFVWDCYAWSAWQFFQVPKKDGTYQEIPGDWKNYSGDFPLWRWSYEIIRHFRMKFEYDMEWSFQRLFSMPPDDTIPWLSYQHFSNLIGNLTDMIVAEQNWQPMFDEIWNNRQVADYTGKNNQKRDFMRSWNHDRTAAHYSLEDMQENGITLDGDVLYDIADPRGDFEKNLLSEIHMEQFQETLTEQDRQILKMRYDGHSLKEIADAVGFKTPSAVAKRIEKIAGSYEDFVGEEYQDFLDKHDKA